MKKLLSASVILSLAALLACNKGTGTSLSPAEQSAKIEQKPITLPNATPPPTADTAQIFKGKVAEVPVTAKLNIKDGQISGTYSYDKVGQDIVIKGTLNKSRELKMEEFGNGADKPATATFKGEMSEGFSPTMQLSGDWEKAGGKAAEFFLLNAVNVAPGFQVTPKSIAEKTKGYTVEVSYPEISGGSADLAKLNNYVRTMVEGFVKEFKKGEDLKECRNNCSMNGSYSVVFLSNELASLVYSDDVYLGGAHGSPADHTVNFDLKNGKALELADLFSSGKDYLKPISAACIKELKTREGLKEDPQLIEEGAAPKKDNYQTWALSPKGLLIGFAAYQVGPYAAGSPYVTIPFSELKDYLKPDGPTAALTK